MRGESSMQRMARIGNPQSAHIQRAKRLQVARKVAAKYGPKTASEWFQGGQPSSAAKGTFRRLHGGARTYNRDAQGKFA